MNLLHSADVTLITFQERHTAAVHEADSLYSFKCKIQTNLFALCFNV